MDEGKVVLASEPVRDREAPISAVCDALGVSRATLYRYLGLTAPRGLGVRGRIDSWKAR